jgi:hypothetical protein
MIVHAGTPLQRSISPRYDLGSRAYPRSFLGYCYPWGFDSGAPSTPVVGRAGIHGRQAGGLPVARLVLSQP